ncbi:MAG TPA: DinB family protein [Longimicrobiales bacterium]|nr:DinB family protein [Longimicrobiales bacterium]
MRERPGPDEFDPFYSGYIERVPDADIRATLRAQGAATAALLRSERARERAEHAYAPGKWLLKEVVGHLADTERILAYRALRIARGDATPLAGFDENRYVAGGGFSGRTLDDLTAGLEAVRAATLALLDGLPEDAWTRAGTANEARVTVRALAWIIAGHELHHRAIVEERYLA